MGTGDRNTDVPEPRNRVAGGDSALPACHLSEGEPWQARDRDWERLPPCLPAHEGPETSPLLSQLQILAVGTRLQHLADLYGQLASGLQPVTYRGHLSVRHGQHDAARGLGIEHDAFHRLVH